MACVYGIGTLRVGEVVLCGIFDLPADRVAILAFVAGWIGWLTA